MTDNIVMSPTYHELNKGSVRAASNLHQEVPGRGDALQQLAEVRQLFNLGFQLVLDSVLKLFLRYL